MVPTRANNSLRGIRSGVVLLGLARVEPAVRLGSKMFRSQMIRKDCRSRRELERAFLGSPEPVSTLLKPGELVSTSLKLMTLVSLSLAALGELVVIVATMSGLSSA